MNEALRLNIVRVDDTWIDCPRGGSCSNEKCVSAGGCDKIRNVIGLEQSQPAATELVFTPDFITESVLLAVETGNAA